MQMQGNIQISGCIETLRSGSVSADRSTSLYRDKSLERKFGTVDVVSNEIGVRSEFRLIRTIILTTETRYIDSASMQHDAVYHGL